ncbi:MAG: hypothetical protein RL095_2984 [Verrucomicrobiota bacterium]|jgi:histidine triad (HIT) family protein
MNTCIYCKIASGVTSAREVYRDDEVLVILDPAPVNPGHCVVMPVRHHASMFSLEPALRHRLFDLAFRLGRVLAKHPDYDCFNLHHAHGEHAGQAVRHASIHLVPRVGTDGFAFGWRMQPRPADEGGMAEWLSLKLQNPGLDEDEPEESEAAGEEDEEDV